MSLARQRCFHHEGREAVARCPECAHDYCRECVVEHHGRFICTGCLHKLVGSIETGRRRRVSLGAPLFLLSVLLIWFLFVCLGQLTLSMPDDFHDFGQNMTSP